MTRVDAVLRCESKRVECGSNRVKTDIDTEFLAKMFEHGQNLFFAVS
jgi:hypothetical protein